MRFFLLLLLIISPFNSLAANPVDSSKLPLSGMLPDLKSATVDLGVETRRGVSAHVRLDPQPAPELSKPLAPGFKYFLLSVVFSKGQTGTSIMSGQAAARTYSDNSQKTKTVRLESAGDNWSALLTLNTKGETLIKVGSKLEDGKKRIFRFFFNMPDTEPSGGVTGNIPAN
ncbi:hypothetical protein [Geopsychrobacter electrodiphilus]|uniref:hypothetical protein n=1 Tax=Geopsychrobacter electrodiphilus TaxID=225196 RepID=UPI00037EE858|nr:hypothetical protein [Geopsychrobacter electrodiphilus]